MINSPSVGRFGLVGPVAAGDVPEQIDALAVALVAALVVGGLGGVRAFGSWERSSVIFLRKRWFLWVGILLPWSTTR